MQHFGHQLLHCQRTVMTPNFLLLLVVVTAAFGKYVYVKKGMHWDEAQKYCRDAFTDLAPISNEYDISLLYELNDQANNQTWIWIGLMRNVTDRQRWLWSGGGEITETFWQKWEPNDLRGREDNALITRGGWMDVPYNFSLTFFCYKVHAVGERKTWEDALQHCRKHHRDLASVASETELMLMQKELGKLTQYITEHVWISLRFLAGDWLWADGQPYGYEAWGQGGRPLCPAPSEGCAALQVTGLLESTEGLNVVVGITDVKVWNPRSCDEKLHFLCY